MRIVIFILLVTILSVNAIPQNKSFLDSNRNLDKVGYVEYYNYIAVNNIKMWIGSNGKGSHDPINDGCGFYWPGGEKAYKFSVFEDGLIFGAKVNDEILFGGSIYQTTMQGGKVINGQPADPSLEKYRVYKINRNWEALPPGPERELRKKDYLEWPIEDGAPYEDLNGDGKPTPGIDKPKFLGDETLWCVSNDLTFQPRADYPLSSFSAPLGLEMHTTVFGYKRLNILGDVVFKGYKLINKGGNYLRDMYISYFSDPDLGDAGDDYIGCDTLLHMGYAWNSRNSDWMYGTPPPALGYSLMAGPMVPGTLSDSALHSGKWIKGIKNLGMTSFIMIFEANPWDPQPVSSSNYYKLLQGKTQNGTYFNNPVTGQATDKILSGDPVTGNGWYEGEGWPGGPPSGDRRMYLSSGPFNLAPGDTQEVVYAIHMARGTNHKSSIADLREQSKRLKEFYLSEFSKPESYTQLKNIPEEFLLEQNYPNPFNPGTTITYHIPIDGNVVLKVYDIIGNEIASLVNEYKPAGTYQVIWQAANYSAGIYFYQIETRGYVRTKKMVLMK